MKKLEKIKLLTINFYKNFMRTKTGKSIFYSSIFFVILLIVIMASPKEIDRLFKLFSGGTWDFSSTVVLFVSVFLSCEFITNEIKENTIQFLFTKPIKPSEIILSKWISLNLVVMTTLIFYLIIFHICGVIIFHKFFLKMDLAFATLFVSSFLLSSFTFFLTSIYPSISTAVFIIIFGTGIIEFFLKALINLKPLNFYGIVAKKISVFIFYILFYIFPSYQSISLEPDEILWTKTFWINYFNYFIYAIFGTALYLFLSIYTFGLKRKSYYKQ